MDGQRVIVTDVQMRFGSMVTFMVKWTLAAIPAMVILLFVGYFLVAAMLVISGGTLTG